MDGTAVGIAGPKCYIYQIVVYSGHKRNHSLKYQAVNTPDEMILHKDEPIEGRRQDWFMYIYS